MSADRTHLARPASPATPICGEQGGALSMRTTEDYSDPMSKPVDRGGWCTACVDVHLGRANQHPDELEPIHIVVDSAARLVRCGKAMDAADKSTVQSHGFAHSRWTVEFYKNRMADGGPISQPICPACKGLQEIADSPQPPISLTDEREESDAKHTHILYDDAIMHSSPHISLCGEAIGDDEYPAPTVIAYRQYIQDGPGAHRLRNIDWCEACTYKICPKCHGLGPVYGPRGCPARCWIPNESPKQQMSGAAPGVKHDQGKLRWDLQHVVAMQEVIKTLTFGAQKYTADGWRSVKPLKRRYIGAAFRHISQWLQGERIDEETQCHHLACACFSLMCIIEVEMESGDSPLEPVEVQDDSSD